MALTKKEAYEAAIAADKAWSVELIRAFGKRDAGNARYEKRGRGEEGSALRATHDAWVSSMNTARALGVVP